MGELQDSMHAKVSVVSGNLLIIEQRVLLQGLL